MNVNPTLAEPEKGTAVYSNDGTWTKNDTRLAVHFPNMEFMIGKSDVLRYFSVKMSVKWPLSFRRFTPRICAVHPCSALIHPMNFSQKTPFFFVYLRETRSTDSQKKAESPLALLYP
jgi:hypothetical protein